VVGGLFGVGGPQGGKDDGADLPALARRTRV